MKEDLITIMLFLSNENCSLQKALKYCKNYIKLQKQLEFRVLSSYIVFLVRFMVLGIRNECCYFKNVPKFISF